MTATLAQLTTPLTVDEASAVIYSAIGVRGTDATTWKAGSPVRTIIAGLSIIVAAFSSLVSLIARSGFLALSTGAWLELVAFYVYGVTKDQGSFATGTVRFVNGGVGVYGSIAIGALVVKNNTTGKTYRNTAVVSIGSGATVAAAMQADEIGSASTSAATTIATMVSALAGVTCSNPAALVGSDAEDDATLRLRCAEKLGSLSPNGAPDAYAYVARSSKRLDGSAIGVTRVRTIPDGLGGLDLYVATATGGVTGTVGNTSTDLGKIDDDVQTQTVPRGITCRSHTAGTVSIAPTYELWIPESYAGTDAQAQALVAAALLAFVSTRPIGGDVISPASGFVYKVALEDVIGSAVSGAVKRSLTVPAGDTAIGATAAPVLGAITCTGIHRVPGATQ